jgi:hypothetical protein
MTTPTPNGPLTGWLSLLQRALGGSEILWTRFLLILALAAITGFLWWNLDTHDKRLAVVQESIGVLATAGMADMRFQYVDCLRRARTGPERADCRAIRAGRDPESVGEDGGPR